MNRRQGQEPHGVLVIRLNIPLTIECKLVDSYQGIYLAAPSRRLGDRRIIWYRSADFKTLIKKWEVVHVVLLFAGY